MLKNILVVCIGNICRSPIGEILLADRFLQNNLKLSVSSAGLSALVNHPADPMSQTLMQERDLDLSHHRARQISSKLIFGSDLILTMDTAQQIQIERQYPSVRGRVHRIGKWSGYDIPDPYKRPRVIFEQSLTLIEQGLDEWYQKLWSK